MKLDDGILRFEVTVDGETTEWVTDVVSLAIAAENANGELSDVYERLGCPACTPELAERIRALVRQKQDAMLAAVATEVENYG